MCAHLGRRSDDGHGERQPTPSSMKQMDAPRVGVLEVLADDAHDGDERHRQNHARDAPQHGPEGCDGFGWNGGVIMDGLV